MENQQKTQNSDMYLIRDFLNLCLAHWGWFALSLIICLSVGILKVLKSPHIYERTAVILIKESYARHSSNELETLLNAGGLSQTNSKLVNEMASFQSPDLIREVVTRLNLEVSCYSEGRFKNTVMYGSGCPIDVKFLPDRNNIVAFRVERNADSLHVFEFSVKYPQSKKAVKLDIDFTINSGDTLVTEYGSVLIADSPAFTGKWENPVLVTYRDASSVTASYAKRVKATAEDTKNFSDIMDLALTDESTERADDFLNTLIAVYNESWVNDMNTASRGTAYFINERLNNIERELNLVDEDISSFKSRNLVPDINAISDMYIKKSSDIEAELREIDNQLHVIQFTKNFMINSTGKGELIPAPAGISNATISTQIATYNTTLLQRNKLADNSSDLNPTVKALDPSLKAMRESILSSLDNEIEVLELQVDRLSKSEKQTAERLADNPNQAKYLLNIERQQKVKETIYLYLLQKREENELSQAFTAYNSKVISRPSGSSIPVSPRTSRIILIALVLGLAIPAGILYAIEALDSKVRGRKDLENLSFPLLGEVPQIGDRRSSLKMLKKSAPMPTVLVKPGLRDTINESFRVLRTNVEFVAKSSDSKVFSITSFNAGSGKSFISANLGAAIAITGKKILLIDGDLRHASTSDTFSIGKRMGLADYLAGKCSSDDDLIVHVEDTKGLDVLPVGTIPPNPSELISSPKFSLLIKKYREEYDYVMIDCPPVEIVADTQIIETLVDRTMFVIRAGLLERTMLPTIEGYKNRPEYKNIAVILNGTEIKGSYYGYRYGYGYNYSYAYHYYSDSDGGRRRHHHHLHLKDRSQ